MFHRTFRNLLSRYLVTALLLLPLASQAAAGQQAGVRPRMAEGIADAVKQFRTLRGGVAETFVQIALMTEQLADFQLELALEHRGIFQLQPTRAYAMAGPGLVGVFIPVAGGAGYSTFQVWFDRASREVISTVGALFDKTQDGLYRAQLSFDRQRLIDALLTADGRLVDGWAIDANGRLLDLDELAFAHKDFGCFLDCLGDFGVPNALLVVAGILCGIICGGTLGAGCLLCLAGIGLVLGLEGGICTSRCS